MGSKKLDTCSRDAISWLPDEVLGKILSLLPTEQAVSTSVLSKKWRKVYRLVDNLDFDDSVRGEDKLERDVSERFEFVRDFNEGYDMVKKEVATYMFPESFKNFVDTTLAWQGDYSPMKKFSLKCHVGAYNNCQKTRVEGWISNIVERGVLEMDLRINDQGLHFLPPQLFKSKTLVKLTLGTNLSLGNLPSYVSLPSLKTLFIDSVCFHYFYSFSALLACCPVLEELSVHYIDFKGRPYTITSPTVKRLSVNFSFCDDRKELSLNLPNLVYLDYSDFALAEYPQVNLKSLVEAKLDLRPVGYMWTADFLLGIRNVKTLHLSPFSVDVIAGSVKHDGLFVPVFNNLVSLSFGSYNKFGWNLLPYLLEQFPKLETLIIQDLNCYRDVSMPLNKVKMLHIMNYRDTAQALHQLKSFVGEFKSLEAVQVEFFKTKDVLLQAKKDLMMLLGVSLPSNCLFKVI